MILINSVEDCWTELIKSLFRFCDKVKAQQIKKAMKIQNQLLGV